MTFQPMPFSRSRLPIITMLQTQLLKVVVGGTVDHAIAVLVTFFQELDRAFSDINQYKELNRN